MHEDRLKARIFSQLEPQWMILDFLAFKAKLSSRGARKQLTPGSREGTDGPARIPSADAVRGDVGKRFQFSSFFYTKVSAKGCC